jgi:uncharacterized protein YbbK (DUF523 family)
LKKTKVLVSACLLGEPCRYDGGHSQRADLLKHISKDEIVPVCPELEGGLPAPRPPAEIREGRAIRENGEDVTDHFIKGAKRALNLAQQEGASKAILKGRSPSCGCGQIYDGHFAGNLIHGDGITTQILKQAGIHCISDEEFLLNPIEPVNSSPNTIPKKIKS